MRKQIHPQKNFLTLQICVPLSAIFITQQNHLDLKAESHYEVGNKAFYKHNNKVF